MSLRRLQITTVEARPKSAHAGLIVGILFFGVEPYLMAPIVYLVHSDQENLAALLHFDRIDMDSELSMSRPARRRRVLVRRRGLKRPDSRRRVGRSSQTGREFNPRISQIGSAEWLQRITGKNGVIPTVMPLY
jgi:hypothetical protein